MSFIFLVREKLTGETGCKVFVGIGSVDLIPQAMETIQTQEMRSLTGLAHSEQLD